MLILYDKTLAKDIVQNCFLTVWERHTQLEPDKSFSSYLYTITRSLIYKETERLILNTRFIETKEHPEELDNHTVESLNASFLEEYINKYIEALPRISRQIFLLKKEEGLSNQEIANQLNITERSVASHHYRTLKYLREKMKEYLISILF